jgi:hypothetical protein
MSEDEYQDFVSELYCLVREEAALWEVPLGVTDHLSTGPIVHGPWRVSDCARVLGGWQRHGLQTLYRPNRDASNGPDLPSHEVVTLLADPGVWIRTDGPVGGEHDVHLVIAPAGEALPQCDWYRLVTRG